MKLYPKRIGGKRLRLSKEDLAHIEHLKEISDEKAKPSAVAGVGKRKLATP